MAMNVTSKTAIITGAGSGINFSYAKLLLSKGCNVLIADLSLRPEAEELVAKYPLTGEGAKAVFQKTDVADWKQLDKMFEVAIEHFGSVDIVCPGAGVYEPVSYQSLKIRGEGKGRECKADFGNTVVVQFLARTGNSSIERRSCGFEVCVG